MTLYVGFECPFCMADDVMVEIEGDSTIDTERDEEAICPACGKKVYLEIRVRGYKTDQMI